MLRITSAASGEEVACLNGAQFDAMVKECGSSLGSLKRFLAEKHFKKQFSRFQLRFLREGDPDDLKDDEILAPAMDLQLILLMEHLQPDEHRDVRFIESCRDGDAAEVEKSLKALQNPHVSQDGSFPLHWAVRRGHLGVVRLLLEASSDTECVDDGGNRPLHHAAAAGDPELVRVLLENNAEREAEIADSIGGRPLHQAIAANHLDVVRLLIASRVDLEATILFGHRPLHEAAMRGHVDIARALLNAGARTEVTDRFGNTASQVAFDGGYEALAEMLGQKRRRRS